LTVLMLPFRHLLGVLNVLLLYLILAFVLALTAGAGPAVLSAVLAFVAFDYFFIPPYHTFSVADRDHVLALFVYLGVAIVTAHLVARLRARTEEALREGRRTALLAELNAALIEDVTLDAILTRIAERVVTVYGAEGCRVLLPGPDGALRAAAYFPPTLGPQVDRTGLVLADWAMEHRQPIGRSQRGRRIVEATRGGRRGTERDERGTEDEKHEGRAATFLAVQRGPSPPSVPLSSPSRPPRDDVLFLPIKTAQRVVGVLAVIGRPGTGPFRAEDERLLTTFVDQAALALERARLSEEAAQAAALAKSDELKSALLAAVSHDLRTPLASIKASATSLLDDSVTWDAATRRDLLTAIDEETDRLALMVSNLLDLSRIEGGALRPQKAWYDVDELIADVQARMATRAEGHSLTVTLEPNLPLLRFDYVEIAQVLVNLIENAITYTPLGTPITIGARRIDGAVEITVHDEGPGIPLERQARIFEKFYRARVGTVPIGTGIGLAISKGLVEANGGQIGVESAPGAGTTFRFTLPLPGDDGVSSILEKTVVRTGGPA
jgi:two-component system sensor histidine kinase KdpD